MGVHSPAEALRRAYKKDPTWNREERTHTCCSSRVHWRHKADCQRLAELNSDNLADLRDI